MTHLAPPATEPPTSYTEIDCRHWLELGAADLFSSTEEV